MNINRRTTCLALATAPISMNTPATANTSPSPSGFKHVPWSQQTSIYEVNVRQFTPQGTLAAFASQLPRLARLGVGILWFMPIQPIGVLNRKGGLGSYYSISDYTAVNPEFGTLADFKRVVTQAHALGMKVILDWVANHTAWDHPWVATHKQRYKLNAQGDVYSVTFNAGQPSVEYWTDVVGLSYTAPGAQQDLWPAMTQAMAFWLQQADIDGFRCDVASLVPTPFWEQARVALDRIKPVFMLAESDQADLHAQAFDMTYDWDLFDQFKAIAKGQANASTLPAWWQRRLAKYPADAYRMSFTANHDSNSWHGSCAEIYGSPACFKLCASLAAVLPGMPLVYGGQEGYFKKRLAFFERDPIDWNNTALGAFYAELLQLKKHHPALANDHRVGTLKWPDAGNPQVLQLVREHQGRAVGVLANLSAVPQACRTLDGQAVTLQPWACEVAVS
jgi:glycosidase